MKPLALHRCLSVATLSLLLAAMLPASAQDETVPGDTQPDTGQALRRLFVSDKLWQSLSAEQRGWVQAAANEVSAKEPAKAFELERSAAAKLKSMGVKIVDNVDKKSFTAVADPYLDKLAKELGPHADKIKTLIRAIN